MFDERANRGPEFIAIFTVGLALAAVSVVLRLWVRWKIIRKFGLDDGFAAASLVRQGEVFFNFFFENDYSHEYRTVIWLLISKM